MTKMKKKKKISKEYFHRKFFEVQSDVLLLMYKD